MWYHGNEDILDNLQGGSERAMDVEWADLHPALVVWGWRHKAGKGCVSYRWELEAANKLKLEYTKAVFAADDDAGGTDSSSEVRSVTVEQ